MGEPLGGVPGIPGVFTKDETVSGPIMVGEGVPVPSMGGGGGDGRHR